MDTATALQIVLDLARQNMVDPDDNEEEYLRQAQAIAIIEDLAVNEYGDD
jgi:hypothetical protein